MKIRDELRQETRPMLSHRASMSTLRTHAMSDAHRLDHKPFLVPPGKKIRLKDYDPGYTAGIRDKAAAKEALLQDVSELAKMQDVFWASKEYALIIILQALDAAGKDSTIKHVMSGVNPQGVIVHSFKAPTDEERLHHFLWRPMRVLPPAGTIAIFNRSYYEEVLVVRVHPEFLESQRLCRRACAKRDSITFGNRATTKSTRSRKRWPRKIRTS